MEMQADGDGAESINLVWSNAVRRRPVRTVLVRVVCALVVLEAAPGRAADPEIDRLLEARSARTG